MVDLQLLIQSGISAASGLLGVFVGGWLTGSNQKKERQNNRRREQLMELYAPLRGMRAEIKAKSELRTKINSAAGDLWLKKFSGVAHDPEAAKKIDSEEWEKFEKVLDYSNSQLEGEIIPLYRKMLEHLSAHMGLAEQSTLAHYPEFVEFVEIWNRFLDKSLPRDLIIKIDHAEKNVYPLYDDIEENFKRLSSELKE